MTHLLIAVENISYFLHPQLLIQDLNFTVKRGECMAFIGTNGTGKTTTLSLLAGLLRPLKGQVLIHGLNIHTKPLGAKQHLGFLSDALPLYHELSVKEYLNFICKLRQVQEAPTAIETVIETLDLKPFLHSLIGILSKGLKQRVAIAQAIIHQPCVLLLDEPTQGLDSAQIESLQIFLSEYKKNAAIILSSHYAQEVEGLCDSTLQFSSEGIKHHDIQHCPA